MPSANDIVVFDKASAQRIGKAVRRLEGMPLDTEPSGNKQQFSLIEVFVPRSGPVDDIYTGDVYYYNPSTSTLTLALEDQTAEVLPDTL